MMKNKEQRKYIREAIRLVELKQNGEKVNTEVILDMLKLADEQVKNLTKLIFRHYPQRKSVCTCTRYEYGV